MGESGLSPRRLAPRAELPRTEGPGASVQPPCPSPPTQAGDRAFSQSPPAVVPASEAASQRQRVLLPLLGWTHAFVLPALCPL